MKPIFVIQGNWNRERQNELQIEFDNRLPDYHSLVVSHPSSSELKFDLYCVEGTQKINIDELKEILKQIK